MDSLTCIHVHHNKKGDYEFDNPSSVFTLLMQQEKGEVMIHITEPDAERFVILIKDFLKVNYDIREGAVQVVSPKEMQSITHVYNQKAFQRYLLPFIEGIILIAKLQLLLELKKMGDECEVPAISGVISKNHIDANHHGIINVNHAAIMKTVSEIEAQIKSSHRLFRRKENHELAPVVYLVLKEINSVSSLNDVENIKKRMATYQPCVKTKAFSK